MLADPEPAGSRQSTMSSTAEKTATALNGRIPVSFPWSWGTSPSSTWGPPSTSPRAAQGAPAGRRAHPESALRPHLKRAGEPPITAQGRVMHVTGDQAGIALATGDLKIFESASTCTTAGLKDPKLALRSRSGRRRWSSPAPVAELPLEGASSPGRALGLREPEADRHGHRRAQAGHRLRLVAPVYVPFMLVERGLVSLYRAGQPIEDVPAKPIARQPTGTAGLRQPMGARRPPRRPGARKPGRERSGPRARGERGRRRRGQGRAQREAAGAGAPPPLHAARPTVRATGGAGRRRLTSVLSLLRYSSAEK
jgi:hypothetical protein